MTQPALGLIEQCIQTNDIYLNLGNCSLTDEDFLKGSPIDLALQKCTHLKTLILSNVDRGGEIGTENNFHHLPYAVASLSILSTLICHGSSENKWKIQELAVLSHLSKLQYLDLGFNGLNDINGVSHLRSLKRLVLNNNEIKDIENLQSLLELEFLNLSQNKITEASGLCKLLNLKELNLSGNRIRELKGLNTLHALQALDISNNRLFELRGFENFKDLEELHLANNSVGDLKELEGLRQLRTLDVSDNFIGSLQPLLPLLQMGDYPKRIIFSDYSTETKTGAIDLSGNPLSIPPVEVVKQGAEAVVNYFREIEEQGTEYLYEAKMLIVGQPRAGKTSLRFKLFDSAAPLPQEDQTTRGIDIERLHFDVVDKDEIPRKFYYNVWDFGGQQIYLTTHQFFLTNRSLYVLVIDTGKDSTGNDDTTVNYWLQVVELLGGSSPLLLVRNEKNERQVYIDLPQKRSRFEFLKKDYCIDLNALIPGTDTYNERRAKEFRLLKEDIYTELKRLPLVGFAMPRNWAQIREELQGLSRSQPYITRQDYMHICNKSGVHSFEKQMELSRIFHDLGVFLHFQDFTALEEFIILQNTWATDAVFAVLDNAEVQAKKGTFTDEDLTYIWNEKGYEQAVHKKLLALMMRFELCYQVQHTRPAKYIVPEMLSDKAPIGYAWPEGNELLLQYRYDFMPKGIITRLIVRLHRYIHVVNGEQLVWKTGVNIDGAEMQCPNTFAQISETWDNKQLFIRVRGSFPKDLMNKVSYEIDALSDDFFKQVRDSHQTQKSRWYKMIPCNCSTCSETNDKQFYDYVELMARKEFGKLTIECKKMPFENVNISALIDGVFGNDDHRIKDCPPNAKRIFISYAHEDEDWKDQLIKHLSPLRDQELIIHWHDRQIEEGAWDNQIKTAMGDADIFLFLVTPNFLASSYVSSKEVTTAYARFRAGKAKIFPIICDSCDWYMKPISKTKKEFHAELKKEMYPWLGQFQALPRDGKPIKNWPNPQTGFTDAVEQLRKYLLS